MSRAILFTLLLVSLSLFFLRSEFIPYEDKKESQPLTEMVYPFVDAANSRWFFFSSASRPFGMVNLSPDMSIDGAWNSGYRYNEDTIRFFSHIHAWQLSGVPVMPTSGEFKGHLGSSAYGSSYSHDDERALPGYHQVSLKDYDINVELTSTLRVGFHRYTFNKSEQNSILIDLGTVLGPSATKYATVHQFSDRSISGHTLMAATNRRPKDTRIYFHIELDQAFRTLEAWQDGALMGETNHFEGENGGVYFTLNDTSEPILMKVAISYVSEEQARLNMEMELNHWNFDEVVEASKKDWDEKLGRIEISGNDEKQRRRFYTDLWKALQGRRIISDANGKYCDMTGDQPRTGQVPLNQEGKPQFNHYNSDSFWGSQWTITTLWDLVYPEIAEEFIQSMLLMYDDGGLIPRGPSGGNYTYVMTGASSTPFIVSAYMKGIRGFDIEKAYKGLRKNHLPGGIMGKAGYEHETFKGGGLQYYIDRGYIPFPLGTEKWGGHQDGAGQTLEYAYQDWCLAQLAKALGKEDDHEMFMRRSTNWKNLFDQDSKWMRPRGLDGTWNEPYDPFGYEQGFVEANAAQSTWYVPHDFEGLSALMGGKEIAVEKLNASFQTAANQDFTAGKSHNEEKQEQNRRIPINYGNQPSIHTAFVFNHLDQPWLTQYWSREVVNHVFSDLSPERGYSGDEDQGLMGSLAVLMKLGLFEVKSGAEQVPKMDIGSPIFDKVVIHLHPDYYSGEKIEILANGNSDENRYIQSAQWNGTELRNPEIVHGALTKGGVLTLEMTDKRGDQEN